MIHGLSEILSLDVGSERTAFLVAWVQDLYHPAEKPVLVGGSAVELFTRGAYVTGDIDLVGSVPGRVGTILRKYGFIKEGRYWIHEEGRVFLEFPSSSLDENECAVSWKFAGRDILIVSPEDLIVDRLSAWVHWESPIDGVNAYLVYCSLVAELDSDRLRHRARQADVPAALEKVISLFRGTGGKIPEKEELEEWAEKIPKKETFPD